jgi:hypothetical protein
MDLKRLAQIDRATLAYVAALGAALAWLWRDGLPPSWIYVVVAHVLLAVLACLAPLARRGPGRLGKILAEWYPLILLVGLYNVLGVINLEEARAYDRVVQAWELRVFGVQASAAWIRAMPNPVLSWILHACYLAYYLILYAAPIGLWLSGRRDAARSTILAIMLTFYVCYLLFVLIPVAGPRYMFPLADNAATSIAPARFAQWLLNRGDAWGAAFPSSHVAACLVAAVMALRAWRSLGLVLIVPSLGLAFGVVYGQFHYGIDALGGLIMAALVLTLFRTSAESMVVMRALPVAARVTSTPPPMTTPMPSDAIHTHAREKDVGRGLARGM